MMKNVLFAMLLAACGSKQQPAVSNATDKQVDPPGPVQDTRTPLERRRDDACKSLGPRLTACAADDARAAFEAGQLKKAQYDEITKPEVRAKNTEEFIDKCTHEEFSSRQVRVLEVCQKEESECGPLSSCLANLAPQQP